jgi:hypothetical protein
LDVSEQTFDRTYRPKIPADAIKTSGRRVYVQMRALIDQLIAESAVPKSTPTDIDPMLSGGDSPGLERYRNAKADLTEMERERLRGNLIPRDDLEISLAKLGGVLRRAGESLQRQWGNEAAGVLNEAVDEAECAWEQLLAVHDKPVADAAGPQAAG